MKLYAKQLAIVLLFCATISACKKDTASPEYKTLLLGKWLWYKTVTTSSQPNQYNTFYNQAMFKEFLSTGKVLTTSNGQTTTENYFVKDNQLGQTYNSGKDTAYSQILHWSNETFSIYDKATYTNFNPPAVVEYWHYFVKL
jgi:hypothetical protein